MFVPKVTRGSFKHGNQNYEHVIDVINAYNMRVNSFRNVLKRQN